VLAGGYYQPEIHFRAMRTPYILTKIVRNRFAALKKAGKLCEQKLRMMEGELPASVLGRVIASHNPFSPDLHEMANPLSASLI
jgi:hypothetical protein